MSVPLLFFLPRAIVTLSKGTQNVMVMTKPLNPELGEEDVGR